MSSLHPMNRTIIRDPMPRRVNLHRAHPRNRHMRPDRREQRRNRVESVVMLALALVFLWGLGRAVHKAVMAGSKPFVAGAQRVAEMVSGR